MGREIRRVPPGWEHPRQECQHSPWRGGCDDAKAHDGQCYHPMHDEDYDTASKRWLAECLAWDAGTHKDLTDDSTIKEQYPYYWDWNGNPPDKKYYRQAWDSEPTWYQVYETVSEGTPVTPAFATQAELIDYLVSHGDYWDQARGDGGWQRAHAEAFVGRGWASSLMTEVSSDGLVVKEPRDGI